MTHHVPQPARHAAARSWPTVPRVRRMVGQRPPLVRRSSSGPLRACGVSACAESSTIKGYAMALRGDAWLPNRLSRLRLPLAPWLSGQTLLLPVARICRRHLHPRQRTPLDRPPAHAQQLRLRPLCLAPESRRPLAAAAGRAVTRRL